MRLLIWLRLLWSIGRTQLRDPRLSVSAKGGDSFVRARTRSVAIVVNDYSEGFGALFKRQAAGDGHFTFYAIRRLSVFTMLKLGLRMALGAWKSAEEFDQYEVGSISVRSRKAFLRVMNDGELVLLPPPLRYRIHQRSLVVLLPAEQNPPGRANP